MRFAFQNGKSAGIFGFSKTRLLLLSVIFLAAVLRFWSIDFGMPGKYRPDEEGLVFCAVGFHSGDLNPHFFLYPTFYMYVLSVVYAFVLHLGAVCGWEMTALNVALAQNGYAALHLIGRLLSAMVGTVSVYAVYRLGRKTLDAFSGTLAAFLLATNFIHVRDSHFATTDIPMTLFSILALAAMADVGTKGRYRDYGLAALWTGLAVSTKYTAVALGIPFALAHCQNLLAGKYFPWKRRPLLQALLALGTVILVFAGTSPYFFLDFGAAREGLKILVYAARHGLPGVAELHGWHWVIVFCLKNALGKGVLALAFLGIVMAVIRARKNHKTGLSFLMLASFPVALIVVLSQVKWAPIRYMTALAPVMVLLAVYAVHIFAAIFKNRRAARFVSLGIILCVSYFPFSRAIAFDKLLGKADTRSAAAAWIVKNVPPGSKIGSPNPVLYGKPELPDGYRYVSGKTYNRSIPDDADWVIIDEYPIRSFSPSPPPQFQKELSSHATLVATFDPFVKPSDPGTAVFDISDAFYAPVAGFESLERPGPRISIYRVKK